MTTTLYVIAPDNTDPQFPVAVSRDGFVLNRYRNVEDAWSEWCYYSPVVWDEPLAYLGDRLDFDPEADAWEVAR